MSTTENDGPPGEVPPAVLAYESRIDVGRAEIVRLTGERDAAGARVRAVEALVESGEASDGYHTHRELYDYRMLYNAHAAQGWLAAGVPVVKSRRHSDGEPCFGGGWFIVTATLSTGQVSNHYRDEHWDLFTVPEVDLPPEYDGHTPADAADRLRAALSSDAAPQAAGVTRERAAAEIMDVRRTPGAVKGSAGTRKRQVVEAALLDAARRILDDRHAGDVYPEAWLVPVADAPAAPGGRP